MDPIIIFEQITKGLNSEKVSATLNAITIFGYLRETIFSKFIDSLKKTLEPIFPDVVKNKKKQKIFLDICISLENFIKNSSNTDEEIFKEINTLIKNGIVTEEMHLKIYLEKLMKLNMVDLIVLEEIVKNDIEQEITGLDPSDERLETLNEDDLLYYLTEKSKLKEELDKGIVEICLKNLFNNDIINKIGKKTTERTEEGDLRDVFYGTKVVDGIEEPVFGEEPEWLTYRSYTFKNNIGEKIIKLLNK